MYSGNIFAESVTGALGRVLIVNKDPQMRQALIAYLGQHSCPTVAIDDPTHVMQQIESGGFSLVLLDLELGQKDGMDVLRQIRRRSSIPVIVLSGQQQDDFDRVLSLELGADDYLAKPVNLRELLARARATLRRQEMGRIGKSDLRQRGGFRFGDWELRRKTRSLANPAGHPVVLTKSEYALLVAFLESPGCTLSREQLLQATRTQEDIFDRSIDVQVLRLRRKLTWDGDDRPLILTERGVGYLFQSRVERLF